MAPQEMFCSRIEKSGGDGLSDITCNLPESRFKTDK